jgi:hypothetical protein
MRQNRALEKVQERDVTPEDSLEAMRLHRMKSAERIEQLARIFFEPNPTA